MTKEEQIDTILDIAKNNIIIRRSWNSPYNLIIVLHSIIILNGIPNNMRMSMKGGKVYYYFNKKYEEQFKLNPQLVGDILIEKYPDRTINRLIK